MANALDSLKKHSVIVADTGDLDAVQKWRPQDTTTNPSILLAAAQDPRYRSIVQASMAADVESTLDRLFVAFGCEILKLIPGRVSTEVDARLSFDERKSVEKAKTLVSLYEAAGFGRERVLIKLASTWEGIRAAERLEREGIHCNMTLLFSFAQAVACADAGVTLISPFVGRIYDWHKAARKVDDIPANEDPGVASVTRIYNYYKKHGYATQVMGASFRKTEQILLLAGCDLLTISPDLLEKLSKMEKETERVLCPEKAKQLSIEKTPFDQKAFLWQHNSDAMAVEKLSDGIRKFDADARKLEAAVSELLEEARRLIKTELETRPGGLVARVTIDNPKKLNILGKDVLRRFSGEIKSLEKKPELRAIVLTGSGEKAFIGGADLETLGSLDQKSAREFITLIHEACAAVRDCPVPVIARINGWCLGAGLELAACCDLRIAADSAAFGMPEVRLGIPSVVEAAVLPRLIGAGRSRWLVMTGETIGAAEALVWGLIEKLSSKENLDQTVNHALDAILAGEPAAIRAQKRLCKLWEEAPLYESIATSIDEFARSYEKGEPNRLVSAFRAARKKH